MFFDKNEVIELSGGNKYIVADLIKHEDEYYYYVCEIDSNENKVLNNTKIIKTVTDNGILFIKTVKDEKYDQLYNIFKKRLNIR